MSTESRLNLRTYPKDDARHWRERIFHRQHSPNYTMRFQFRGREISFSLKTGNKELASKRAAAIFRDLVELGVDATVAKHRETASEQKTEAVTIGDWIKAANKVFDGAPATFGNYARAIRSIAADILAVEKNKRRFSRTHSKEYRKQIDAASLSVLGPEAVQAWRIRYVKRAGDNPAKQRTARISANSTLRQAKALFSRRVLKFISEVSAPSPVPFLEAEFYPRESMKYHSKLNPARLLRAAKDSLFPSDPQAFTALLLALGCGLRRGEADKILWRQLDLDACLVHIEPTEAGGLKTADSAGVVPIDDGLAALFRGLKARSRGLFVLEGGPGTTASKPWGQRYRCGEVFNRLTSWLRANGVEGLHPIHTLRKEAGSIIATRDGIHAASRFLRHADIAITAAHYADHKERSSIPIGDFLRPENVIELTPLENVPGAVPRLKRKEASVS